MAEDVVGVAVYVVGVAGDVVGVAGYVVGACVVGGADGSART